MPAARLVRWFDPRGRLSRRAYRQFVLGLTPVCAALLCLAVALAAAGWRLPAFAALAGLGLACLAGLAQTERRLHDRGRTGWWVLAGVALAALSFVPVEDQADAHPVPVLAYAGLTVALALWLSVETLGRAGTAGPNRHGVEPAA